MILEITPSERTALQLLANGNTIKDIAHPLGVSERDVEGHLHALFVRMGAASRDEAVAAALRRGLLESHSL